MQNNAHLHIRAPSNLLEKFGKKVSKNKDGTPSDVVRKMIEAYNNGEIKLNP